MLRTIFWLKAGHRDTAMNYTISHATVDGKATLCGKKIGRMALEDTLSSGLTCQPCQRQVP